MELQPASPPEEAVKAVTDAVTRLAEREFFGIPELDSPQRGNVYLAAWHQAYGLARRDLIADGPCPDAAYRVSWRCLILANDRVVASARAYDHDGRGFECGMLSSGTASTEMAECLEVAEAAPRDMNGPHEPIFLRVPSTYTAALWLRGRQGSNPHRYVMLPVLQRPNLAKSLLTAAEFWKLQNELLAEKSRGGRFPTPVE